MQQIDRMQTLIELKSVAPATAVPQQDATACNTSTPQHATSNQINENKELVLPTNNVADLNRVLEFLNEDIFRGVITDRLYRSNSKKKDNH